MWLFFYCIFISGYYKQGVETCLGKRNIFSFFTHYKFVTFGVK